MKSVCPCCGAPLVGAIPFKLDTRYLVVAGHEPLLLPPIKATILRALIAAWPGACRHDRLYAEVWSRDTPTVSEITMRVHINKLRQLIASRGLRIKSINRFGYQLVREEKNVAAATANMDRAGERVAAAVG